ncbi:MAG: alkaline phosphatase [Gammaproteobacteria bacterium]
MTDTLLGRRRLLELGAGAIAATALPLRAAPRFDSDPFALGVASGYPAPDGAVLWTRLAPRPLEAGGGMPAAAVRVHWEIAHDERFARIAARGTASADPRWAHSVHVAASGLAPDRWYWYRFHAGDATSPPGRLRTAPATDALPARLRLAFASCQHYEHGYYAAYRHMLADELDLVIHLGDYIYEGSWGSKPVRRHGTPEPRTLDEYRARHALYRTDPDLQRAHAACPWAMVWDDHEVENDYAADRSQGLEDPAAFLRRRAAAYQAYYEHMPMPPSMQPHGPDMRIYERLDHGRLARIHLLDFRQYRSYQPCPRAGRGGGNMIGPDCSARLDPAATLLGAAQERWLDESLAGARSGWNLIAQQTLMAQADAAKGPDRRWFSDGWDGYPAARRRLLDSVVARRARNPVVIGGDVHAFWAADLKADFDDPAAPAIASEFVTTSISSFAPPEERFATALAEEPHIRFATGLYRGYTRMEITPARTTVDLRALADARDRVSDCSTLASFVVEDGRPGAQRA